MELAPQMLLRIRGSLEDDGMGVRWLGLPQSGHARTCTGEAVWLRPMVRELIVFERFRRRALQPRDHPPSAPGSADPEDDFCFPSG